jgi:large subunit ribosomal protein L22
MSPRKVRLVIDAVRGLSVLEADQRLQFILKDAARPVLKLLRSAVANAEHNFHLSKEALFVKAISADGGAVLKRFRPRAFGRAAPLRKRTSHINLVIAPTSERVAKKSEKKNNV